MIFSNALKAELEPIRARRKEYEKDIPAVYDILKAGSEKAREIAAQTLDEMKKAMNLLISYNRKPAWFRMPISVHQRLHGFWSMCPVSGSGLRQAISFLERWIPG